ncbi:hypothetical protein DFH09DRAFT_14852 [Mycena vulgaris]|nr:hypothetical protein DFH09DRAFT_14852 [Mycena vulgaris]
MSLAGPHSIQRVLGSSQSVVGVPSLQMPHQRKKPSSGPAHDFWGTCIRDWCFSRPLRWGHRCPAYYVRIAGTPTRRTQQLRRIPERRPPNSKLRMGGSSAAGSGVDMEGSTDMRLSEFRMVCAGVGSNVM